MRDKVDLTTRQLKTARKFRRSLGRLVRLSGSLLQIIWKTGLSGESVGHFWKSLFRVLFTNPGAVAVMLGRAVMNANQAEQSRSYARALREHIAHVEKVGEAAFNGSMLGGSTSEGPAQAR
jgi:Domain of unknown function (DUF4070)